MKSKIITTALGWIKVPLFWAAMGAAVALAGGAYYLHTTAVSAAYEQGYAAHKAITTAQDLAAHNAQSESLIRLQDKNEELENEVQSLHDALRVLGEQRRLAERMRAFDRAQHEAAIANASAAAVRAYASSTSDHLEGCTRDVERFGSEAVTGAAAAHAYRAYVEARNAEALAQRQAIIDQRAALSLARRQRQTPTESPK